MNKQAKTLIPFIIIAVVLIFISIINTIFVKNSKNNNELRYHNLLRSSIKSGDISEIDYEYLILDLQAIDEILEDMLQADVDIKKKTEYYKIAENVYENKINEICAILNSKLDDIDFENLQIDIDEFRNKLNAESNELKSTIRSTVDLEYAINKNYFENKKNMCRELIEKYKEFLYKK